MYKTLVVLLAFGLMNNTTHACDLCTVYLGIQPNDFKNSFSARHRYRLFERDFFGTNMTNLRLASPTGISNKHA